MRAGDLDPPFFHFSDDLVVFDTLEEMTQYIEPWDVHDSDRAFDSRGRRVGLRSEGVERTRWSVSGGETKFDANSSGDRAPDELAARLRDYARVVGPDRLSLPSDRLEQLDLATLVEAVAAFHLTSDETWRRLVAVASALTELSNDTVSVWAFRKRRLLRVTEGLDAGDRWVYGLAEPVRWRRTFSSRWHGIQSVQEAASKLEDFLRERPDQKSP